ncbi:MAG: hypothetical protein C0391_05120 [Anaerolinea sp.]|nr:hypothetical protein [Anaerolinea sp.]
MRQAGNIILIICPLVRVAFRAGILVHADADALYPGIALEFLQSHHCVGIIAQIALAAGAENNVIWCLGVTAGTGLQDILPRYFFYL